ncbi:M56 family metallopeptidase [Velocimicrobium porci]|uniref:Peptidase M56 domain-containing protein n=1 Tax=Velocimicrobium porci TaxID=2606634 RepID=A0A6L5Y179_9FIRM|nr:M56 family metallopeptidase [Velocimicrobium porci]MSS63903.1 hypothetical protein [Velocimicrobium porci]
MEQLFLTTIHMSILSCFVILVILITRLLLSRAPKIFSYVLWSVVFIRLICPFQPESAISLIPKQLTSKQTENVVFHIGKSITSPKALPSKTVTQTNLSSTPLSNNGNNFISSSSILAAIWLSGIICLLFYYGITFYRLQKRISTAISCCDNIYEADNIATPFVLGYFKPRIYIPYNLTDDERNYMICHEQVHIKRKDYLFKSIAFFITCIHWFNPLVWVSFFLMSHDMEMSCDEQVIKQLGSGIKKSYTTSLLSIATKPYQGNQLPISFGSGSIKKRIENILHYKKLPMQVSLLLVVLCFGISFCLLTNKNTVDAKNPLNVLQSQTSTDHLTKTSDTSAKIKAKKIQAFADKWATAFTSRNATALYKLTYNKKDFSKWDMVTEYEKGKYSFGWSSPWPWDPDYITVIKGNIIYIYYYAKVSDPHVTVWKETVKITEKKNKLYGDHIKTSYFDEISSKKEFNQAYKIQSKYYFPDYKKLEYTKIIQERANQKLSDDFSFYSNYKSPETAAQYILNLSGGNSTIQSQKGNEAIIKYSFKDGTSIKIPMYQPEKIGKDGIWVVKNK